MLWILDIAITNILYILLILGTWFAVSPLFLPSIRRTLEISRFRREIRATDESTKEYPLNEHIRMALNSVFGTRSKFSVLTFYVLSFALFCTTLITLVNWTFGKVFIAVFSVFGGLLPYIFLRLRLWSIRVTGSYEAEGLIAELLNQYRINNFNMVEAIDCSIPFLKRCPFSRRALFRLSMALKNYKMSDELDTAIKEFVFSIDTEWATMLGTNISIAVSDGVDVSSSLDDIMSQLKIAKEILEKDKREGSETFFMIKIFAPLLYVLSVFAAIKFFGFTMVKFIKYQFFNPIGLRFAIFTFSLMVLNIIVLIIIKKPKYDF